MTPVDPAAIETLKRLLDEATKEPWLVEDRSVYALKGSGTYEGKGAEYRERQENIFYLGVQAGRDTPTAEVVTNAELIAQLRNLAPALLDERQRLIDRIAALEQEKTATPVAAEQALLDAASLCESESQRWTDHDAKTSQHWQTVSVLLRSKHLVVGSLRAELTAAEQGATALRETLGQEARTFFDKYVRISDRLEQTEHMLAAVVEAFAPIIDSTKGDGKSNWRSVLNVLDYKDVGKVGAWTLEQLNALELPARQAWEVAREALSSPAVPPSPEEHSYFDVEMAVAELKAAGWIEITHTRWQAPDGSQHLGPAGAYRKMKAAQKAGER